MKTYWVCQYYGGAEKNPLGTHEDFWLFVFCQIQQFAKLAFVESFQDWFALIFCCPIRDGHLVSFENLVYIYLTSETIFPHCDYWMIQVTQK